MKPLNFFNFFFKPIKIAFFILCAVASLSMDGCRKYPKEYTIDLGTYTLHEALPYIYFPKGTTWVYENSLTKELDTIVMTHCDTLLKTFRNKPDPYGKPPTLQMTYTVFSSTAKSKTFGYQIEYGHISGGPWNEDKESLWQIFRSYSGKVDGLIRMGHNTAIIYPWSHAAIPKDTNGLTSWLLNEHPVFNQNGIDYKDVIVFRVRQDGTYHPCNLNDYSSSGTSNYYYAKGVGVIRIDISSSYSKGSYINHSWVLKSFTK